MAKKNIYESFNRSYGRKFNKNYRRQRVPRWVESLGYVGAAIGVLLIATVCYFEFFAPEAISPDIGTVVADSRLEHPGEAPSSPELDPTGVPQDDGPGFGEDDEPVVQRTVAAGDTAGEILSEWLSTSDISEISNACKPIFSLSRLRAGQPYSIFRDKGKVVRFEYDVNADRKLVVSRMDPGAEATWDAALEEIEYEIRLTKVKGEIRTSLSESMLVAKESPGLASRLAQIFAWEINFIRDIQPGDSFCLLIEKKFRDGDFKGYGKILMAEFVNRGSKFEAYAYTDSHDGITYFNAAGDSLKRAFLKAPLSFSRISSRFDMGRVHPIFKKVRPHPAIDYAAASGTPVKAIGKGTVSFRGYDKGAGNYITLQHLNGYESMYLHLKGFAKGLQKGSTVKQGEVIGYVGSTGYSTGPHLDFRMKKGGQFINPEKTLSPRDESVPKRQLAAFKKERDTLRAYADGSIDVSQYSPK